MSKGDRLTLVNLVLTSTPLFLLSTYRSPCKVSSPINKIIRDFFGKGLIIKEVALS